MYASIYKILSTLFDSEISLKMFKQLFYCKPSILRTFFSKFGIKLFLKILLLSYKNNMHVYTFYLILPITEQQ